jgi:dihydrofolate synthase / folylpolyglutamate synthase
MKVTAVRTHKITAQDRNLRALLDAYLPALEEKSVVAITSKIVAVTQGRLAKVGEVDRHALIESEADYFLPPGQSRYDATLTIRSSILVPSAGIDESNGNGYYVLWPLEPQQVVNELRAYLRQRFSLHQLGVIVTDSTTTPLRWGVTGTTIAHSGFLAVNDLVGHPDIFGRALHMTRVNVAQGLATAAVLVMGEADEQTPLAVLSDLPFVQFQENDPTEAELQSLRIALQDDLYAPLLQSVAWQQKRRVKDEGERGKEEASSKKQEE